MPSRLARSVIVAPVGEAEIVNCKSGPTCGPCGQTTLESQRPKSD